MTTTLEYRCPNCDGTLSFSSNTQKLTCPFCDTELEAQSVQEYNEAINATKSQDCQWETYQSDSGEGGWAQEETDNLVTHICKSCNGQIIADKNTAVTACPYCDNNVFIPQQFADELKPDYVIPFQLSKEQAKAALREFYKGKPLLNPCFKNENHLDEIKGLYVPFWLYDCDTQNELHYKGTKVRSYSDSRYHYTETKHYSIHRAGTMSFTKIPADGSSKMDDTYMEAVEPYFYQDLKKFTPAYMAGFLADKYDVSANQLQKRVNDRIRTSVVEAFHPRGYATVQSTSANIRSTKNQVHYALLPVWVLNTQYRGELHTFMMNGQTGKMVGKLPVDMGRAVGMFCGIFAGFSLFASSIIYFLM
ncbi:MAG: hypothetical protein R3Y63_07105 [Eubacteriales bacterium]